MPVLIAMQTLCTILLASTPGDRWKSASTQFQSVSSGSTVLIVTLVVSAIGVCCLCLKHKRAEQIRKQKIREMASANETTDEDTKYETPPMKSCDQESPELVATTEAT
jgi:hypothetical protein